MGLKEHIDFINKTEGEVSGAFCYVDTKHTVTSVLEDTGLAVDGHYQESEEKNNIINGKSKKTTEVNSTQKELIPSESEYLNITAESYKEACHVLGVSQDMTYAQAHSAYKRLYAQHHPDRVLKTALLQYPGFKEGDLFLYQKQYKLLEEKFKQEKKIPALELDKFIFDHVLIIRKLVIENYKRNFFPLIEIKNKANWFKHYFSLGEKITFGTEALNNIIGQQENIVNNYMKKELFGLSYNKFQEIEIQKIDANNKWKKLIQDLTIEFNIKRENLRKSWDIYQSFQGLPWEETKDIDIIGKKQYYAGTEYNIIDIDIEDAVIANAYFEKKHSKDIQLLKYFSSIFGDQKAPEIFTQLINALRNKKSFNKEKIQSLSIRLKKNKQINKPKDFDSIIDIIVTNPKLLYIGDKKESFEPTLLFGEGNTWDSVYNQNTYNIPLYLFFCHLYLHTSGTIPHLLGVKLIKRYIPNASAKEIVNILNKVINGENPKLILQKHRKEQPKNCENGSRYAKSDECRKLDLLEDDIREIQTGLNIEISDYNGPYDFKQLGIELQNSSNISIFFPINDDGDKKLKNLLLTKKQINTMYLAMLESPILDSYSSISNLLEKN